ncbi:MAG: LysR family transcriptional regulator [Acidimicrobiales bacterium]
MTPTQLRSFATVVRVGSVRGAASELGVTEAAVSGNVGALRRELDDRLFHPSKDGLVFTPGGLRLAHRAVEILGLQDQTVREVSDAHEGRRMLRVAATSLFAEYAAPGLIEVFSARANDLEVELFVESATRFNELLMSHGADVAIGPKASGPTPFGISSADSLRYEVVAVARPDRGDADPLELPWLLGPSAVDPAGVSQYILQRAGVPESRQRIYSSHAAALDEARDGQGVALAPSFAVSAAINAGSLVRLEGPNLSASWTWAMTSLAPDRASQPAREFIRFASTPRAIQAMLSGSGTDIGRFKPRVHITLWS